MDKTAKRSKECGMGKTARRNAMAWRLGNHKSTGKWEQQMIARGWTSAQINQAISGNIRYPANNDVNPGNPATRYVHPGTGRSVVVDDNTMEVLHVGGDGFEY